MLLTNYLQTKAPTPQLFKKISPSEIIKHQPYKQILIVYMVGSLHFICKFDP